MSEPKDNSGPKGRVLIIAGSDPSGGAGIQADIKSVTANGGYAMTAITALTLQNTTGVYGVIPVELRAIQEQVRLCQTDIGSDCVKLGMLATHAVIEGVADTLDQWAKGVPRVLDPVMVATSGDRLLEKDAVSALQSVLIPGAALVTPNAPEAEILSNRPVENVDGQRRAAERLLEGGAKAALIKGGHVSGDVITDVLQTEYDEIIFESPRIETKHTHGTGCTLASAIAAHIALGAAVPDAVAKARDYLIKAIELAPGFGAGHGPVNHAWTVNSHPNS